MGILDRFKKKPVATKPVKSEAAVGDAKVIEKPKADTQKKKSAKHSAEVLAAVDKAEKTKPGKAAKAGKPGDVKGTSPESYRVLIKPLITEKATFLVAQNKYLFAVGPRMNKIEVKKAIRTVYHVDPVSVNMIRMGGKQVRFGKVRGTRKTWKKAIVTLKPDDKIQVYEGV